MMLAALTATAGVNRVERLAWLTDVPEPVVSGRNKAHELARLLPWTWRAQQLTAAVNARKPGRSDDARHETDQAPRAGREHERQARGLFPRNLLAGHRALARHGPDETPRPRAVLRRGTAGPISRASHHAAGDAELPEPGFRQGEPAVVVQSDFGHGRRPRAGGICASVA